MQIQAEEARHWLYRVYEISKDRDNDNKRIQFVCERDGENMSFFISEIAKYSVHYKLSGCGGTDLESTYIQAHTHACANVRLHFCVHTHTHTDKHKTAHTCRKALFTYSMHSSRMHSHTHSRVDRCMVTGLQCTGLICLMFHMSNCIIAIMNISAISLSLSLLNSLSLWLLLTPQLAVKTSSHLVNQFVTCKQQAANPTPAHSCTCTKCQPASHQHNYPECQCTTTLAGKQGNQSANQLASLPITLLNTVNNPNS